MKRLLLGLLVLVALAVILDAQRTSITNKNNPDLDRIAPSVTISAPTSAATYDAGASATLTTLAGTSSDNSGVAICVWVSDQGTSGTATTSPVGAWSVPTITLEVGDNVITVTCFDPGGNAGADQITVTRSGASTCAHCFFETSFTVAEGWTADRTQLSAACPGNNGFDGIQAGISQGEDLNLSGNCTSITTAGNYASGRGGRGEVFWVGQGVNQLSGSPVFTFDNMPSFPPGVWATELWIRHYVRYPTGLATATSGGSHKTVYFNQDFCGTGVGGCYFLFDGDESMRLTRSGNNYAWNNFTYGYLDMNGGTNSGDGQWHCLEYHVKQETSGGAGDGVVEWWIDGTLRMNASNVTYNNVGMGFGGFTLPNNGVWDTPGGNPAAIHYDDLALSLTQRIGCF